MSQPGRYARGFLKDELEAQGLHPCCGHSKPMHYCDCDFAFD